ncbi:MAG: alcohol dehydrogenase catalytic domain-containing protein [Lachnospiraceae bacterium]|nr:alcohol dehydrogenase catalytic domain-containing protein [Candidatus Equihabitans merdae]
MKAMVMHEFGGKLVLEDIPKPVPADDQVILKVLKVGLCGSDLKITGGRINTTPLPFVPGHEIAGQVVECGRDADPSWLGKRVVLHTYQGCMKRPRCLNGEYNRCENLKGRIGFELYGGLGEYVAVSVNNIVEIPDNVSDKDAAVATCAILSIVHAIHRAGVSKSEKVLMLGTGGLGLHGIQYLVDMGVECTAVDIAQRKLDLAKEYGAAHAITFDEFAASTEKYDVIFDNLAKPEITKSSAMRLTKGGRYVMVAYSPGNSCLFDSEYMHLNETYFVGTRNGTIAEMKEILQLESEGRIHPIIDDVLPVTAVNEALEMIRSGQSTGRVVLSFDLI